MPRTAPHIRDKPKMLVATSWRADTESYLSYDDCRLQPGPRLTMNQAPGRQPAQRRQIAAVVRCSAASTDSSGASQKTVSRPKVKGKTVVITGGSQVRIAVHWHRCNSCGSLQNSCPVPVMPGLTSQHQWMSLEVSISLFQYWLRAGKRARHRIELRQEGLQCGGRCTRAGAPEHCCR